METPFILHYKCITGSILPFLRHSIPLPLYWYSIQYDAFWHSLTDDCISFCWWWKVTMRYYRPCSTCDDDVAGVCTVIVDSLRWFWWCSCCDVMMMLLCFGDCHLRPVFLICILFYLLLMTWVHLIPQFLYSFFDVLLHFIWLLFCVVVHSLFYLCDVCRLLLVLLFLPFPGWIVASSGMMSLPGRMLYLCDGHSLGGRCCYSTTWPYDLLLIHWWWHSLLYVIGAGRYSTFFWWCLYYIPVIHSVDCSC